MVPDNVADTNQHALGRISCILPTGILGKGGDVKSSNRVALLVLTAVFAVNHLDRHVLSITLNAIGQEFTLSDTQLGLLSGLLFAVVYVLFGFPVAKLAARGNRRNIIAVSATIWSTLTIATGAVQNFAQLAVARLGVGVGEAGCVSPAHSMISDLYPPERRTAAMATFAAGANIGILLAFLVGGVVGQALGWRWAFVMAGVPGLLLALVLRFAIEEPEREATPVPDEDGKSLLRATLRTIWHDRGLFHALCGVSITGIVIFGALAWNPTFMIRAHGLSPSQTGVFLALTIGVIGGIGTWASGRLADRLGAHDPGWRMGVVIGAILVAKPFIFGFLLIDSTKAALVCFVGSAFVAGVFWGPTFAYLHSRVDVQLRPMATAVFLFAFNLVGVGIGPTLVGIASDTVFAGFGARSLAYALFVMQAAGIWGAWHYWQVAKQIRQR